MTAEKTFDVTCVGLQAVDILVSDVVQDVMQKDLVITDNIKIATGGDAVNQSIVLSKLGTKVCYTGQKTDDDMGNILLNDLRRYPIVLKLKENRAGTPTSIVLIGKDKERHMVNRMGNNDTVGFEDIDLNCVRNSRILSICGVLALQNFDGEGVMKLLDFARKNEVKTVVDFSYKQNPYSYEDFKKLISLTDYILPSETEASIITGIEDDPMEMAEKLRKMGAEKFVIKLGSKGCLVSDKGKVTALPPFPAKPLDSTGAGDNFCAGFIYSILRGKNIIEAARFGSACGAIAVSNYGANLGVKNVSQVLEFISEGS